MPKLLFHLFCWSQKLGHFQEQTITVFDVQQINVPSLDSRERDRDRERDRETETERETETDRETERQKDREIETEREMGGGGEP